MGPPDVFHQQVLPGAHAQAKWKMTALNALWEFPKMGVPYFGVLIIESATEYGSVFFDRNCMFSHDFLTIMYYVTIEHHHQK